jgi:hypothetical protein
MKIYNEIGSKERFLDIFQKVNKVRLNEAVVQNYSKTGVLDVAFNDLKGGLLKIEKSNTQTRGEETFVELICIDKQSNNVTFTFKVDLAEGDQDGVFDVNDVALIGFTFDAADGSETIELTENDLRQFNMQHKNEFFDVVQNYVDAEEGEPAMDEIYEEAVKKIDSYPFGAKDREGMVKPIQYADEKPTNPKLRVDAPELKKIVNEGGMPDVGKMADYVVGKAHQGHYKSLSPQGKQQYIEMAIDIISKELPPEQVMSMESEMYTELIAKVANAMFVGKMSQMNEQGYDDDDLESQTAVAGDDFNLPPEETGDIEGDDTGKYVDFVNKYKQQKAPEEVPGIDDPLPVEDEPVEQIPEEKKEIINKAYDNLIASGVKAPTMDQIRGEINKLTGFQPKPKERVRPDWAGYIEEGEDKSEYPKELGKEFSPEKQYNKKPKKYSKKIKIKEEFEEPSDPEVARKNMMTAAKYDEMPSPHTTVKSLRQQVDDLTKQKTKGLWMEDDEPVSDAGTGEKFRIGDVVTLEGQEGAYQFGYAVSGGKPPFLMPFDMNTKKADPEQKTYLNTLTNPKFTKVLNFSETDGGFLAESEETDSEPESPIPQGEPEEQKGDDVAQLAKDKEEAGEQIPGGKAEGKSPMEFDLDQLSMGIDVEMEHTDDTMVAFEIAMDHLTEFPDYYTRLKKMEDQAKQEEGGEGEKQASINPNLDTTPESEPFKNKDKEMTDTLLGFKPHNVGDDVDEAIGYDEYKGKIGDKYADAQGNEFAVGNKVKGGVSMKGQSGEKEVATGDLDLMKKMNEMAAGNQKTKVFKIGEYAKGGIIKLVISGRAIQIEALDWNTKQPIESKSFMIDEPNAGMDIDNFLNDLTSSYYAGRIMDWIEINA